MRQFNQLSPEAQTAIIHTLLSTYTGDLPQHVKDEIADWKIYATTQQTIQDGMEWVQLPEDHTLRRGIDYFTVNGGMRLLVEDLAGNTPGEIRKYKPKSTFVFECRKADLPPQQASKVSTRGAWAQAAANAVELMRKTEADRDRCNQCDWPPTEMTSIPTARLKALNKVVEAATLLCDSPPFLIRTFELLQALKGLDNV